MQTPSAGGVQAAILRRSNCGSRNARGAEQRRFRPRFCYGHLVQTGKLCSQHDQCSTEILKGNGLHRAFRHEREMIFKPREAVADTRQRHLVRWNVGRHVAPPRDLSFCCLPTKSPSPSKSFTSNQRKAPSPAKTCTYGLHSATKTEMLLTK